MKNRKIVITMNVVIIIFLFFIAGFIIYSKQKYSLDATIKLLNKREESTNGNMTIESTSKDWGKTIRNVLQKDNLYYINTKREKDDNVTECYYNKETLEMIIVDESQKIIVKLLNTFIETDYSGKAIFMSMCNNEDYKYIGKETIDEKQCIKVCLTENRSDGKIESYFYIDIENGDVVKIENYEIDINGNAEEKDETLYTYSYNTVKEEDNIEFDINNYPDYYFQTITN